MIVFKLKQLLESKEKSLYWLAEVTGVTYPSLHKIINNKTSSIKLHILEKICDALECNISDLLEIKKD